MSRVPRKVGRKTLNPWLVLEAALKIVDAGGAEALTMRKLSSELGVVPMALYNHYSDREAILDAIAEHALGAIAMRPRRGGWKSRLTAMIKDVRDLAIDRPHVYSVAFSRSKKPASAMRLMFEAMDALREAGLSQAEAVRWYHTFVMLLQGFPSWRLGLDRYRAMATSDVTRLGLSAQQAEDLRTIHREDASVQFDVSIGLLLDRLARR